MFEQLKLQNGHPAPAKEKVMELNVDSCERQYAHQMPTIHVAKEKIRFSKSAAELFGLNGDTKQAHLRMSFSVIDNDLFIKYDQQYGFIIQECAGSLYIFNKSLCQSILKITNKKSIRLYIQPLTNGRFPLTPNP